jgi:hypothetical protein
MEDRQQTQPRPWVRAALVAVLAAFSVLAPLVLSAQKPRVLASSYGLGTARFELFAAFAAISAGIVAAVELRARRDRPVRERLSIVAPFLVTLQYATLIGEYSHKPFDYDCYEYAGRAILLGEDPYTVGLNYLYPPLVGQAMALAHRGLTWGIALAGQVPQAETVWGTVFYLYQCAQLGLILLLYFLAVRFARRAGMEAARAPLVVALLLLFDNPLLRTLRHGQVNLWILDLALIAILFAGRMPWLAGWALALSIHMKLYPIMLLLPLAAGRRWRALAWTALGCLAIALVQTDLGRDWSPWLQFVHFYERAYPGEIAFRNSSFHSVAFNTLRFLFAAPSPSLGTPLRVVASTMSVVMAIWLGLRIIERERDARARGPEARSGVDEERRLLTNAADALAFSLLISQSVWEHHFLFALPLVIVAASTLWHERPAAIATSAFMMLGMPTFDLFPLSYHRLVGLVWLLLVTRPRASPFGCRARFPGGVATER